MFDAGSLRKLRLPALLALALLIALGAYYLVLTSRRTTYLNSSNIRLLTTIGHHVDDWVQRQQQIFRIVIGADNPAALIGAWKASSTQWSITEGPRPKDPISIDSMVEPPTLFADFNGKLWLEQTSTWGDRRSVAFDAPILESLQGDVFDIVLLTTTDGRILKRSGQADLYLADLGSLLAPKTFAAEASHTTDVDVDIAGNKFRLFIQPCCGRLRVRTTESDHAAPDKKEPAPAADSRKAAGGKPAETRPEGSREGSGEVAAGTSAEAPHTGLVVCGLLPTATITERRYSISFSTLLIIAGLLLMIVVSWPFMKLALIGNRQRVGLLDVLLLGISSLLVLSLATLYLLDLYAYTRLKAHVDGGLQTFSEAMQSNIRKEIAAAYSQLDSLQSAARDPSVRDAGVEASGRADSRVLVDALRTLPKQDFSFYPFFESFSLIDRDGTQKRKWTTRPDSTPPIPVREREYFLQLRENRGWRLPQECSESVPAGGNCGEWLQPIPAFSLESIRSITRTDTQAVLAMPTTGSLAKTYPVAALALPMISVIKPILPPGFGFAVIEDKDNGRVLFHSDERRNLIEQFFLETDLDRRLRSVVAARRAELLDLRYWGRDYRAYVAPLRGFPWSLVTLYEKDLVRSVNVDWMVTTLLFLILYTSLVAAVCVFVLIRPSKRATWLWPLPGGQTAYLQLSALYLLVIVLFGVAIYAAGRGASRDASGSILLFPAFGIPPVVWLLTYLRLRAARRQALPPAGGERTSVIEEPGAEPDAEPNELLSLVYMCSAALLLVITAVLPTIAFFKVAHSVQVVPFIKYTQLKLAEGLADRRQRAERSASSLSEKSRSVDLSAGGGTPATLFARRSEIEGTQLQFDAGNGRKGGLTPVDIYHPAFETTVARPKGKDLPPAHAGDPLPGFLEPLLPYYSELSVATRELLHDEAGDKTHYWRRGADNRIVLTNAAYGDGALEITSVVPTFGSLPALLRDGKSLSLLEIIAVFLAIGVLAVVIAVFAARRVFLLDMPFHLPRSGSFPPVGQSAFVVCRRPDVREAYLAGRRGAAVDLAALASPEATQEDWDRTLADQEAVLSGEPILVDHFEHRCNDPQFHSKKLWLCEQLVGVRHRRVVILSSIGPVPLLRGAPAGAPDRKADDGPSMEQRWASLLTSSFVVIDLDPRFETDADASAAARKTGRITKSTRALGTWWLRVNNLADYLRNRQYEQIKAALERETTANPYLSPIHEDLKRMIRRRGQEGLDREEILAEFEERASNYYEGLWACCSPVEKLVLEHLAEDGFANYRDAKFVRRLVARGLVKRGPHLQLMNETFRRFVVSTRCRTEVGEVEQDTLASPWDHFKKPFATILALVLVVFVATQKSRFDAAMAVIVGMTGVLPSLLKLAGYFIGERSALPVKPSPL